MPSFRNELVAFEAPEGWDDKTIVAFAAQAEPGKFSPNIVMTKDKAKAGETLRSYADRQIMELARRLEGFDLVESGDRTVAERPAMEYRFRWQSEHAELHQHSVMVMAGEMILNFTGTATHEDEEVVSAAMEQVLSSIELGAPAPYTPAGSPGGAPPPPAGPTGWSRTS